MIQLCLAEKGKVSIQYYFPVQNREYGIADIPGAKCGFESETLYMIQLCLAEKGKVSMQRYFPVQNREYGIADIPGAKRGFESETL